MTATATPTSLSITEWTRLFPKQTTENYTSSVTFMKQLTVIAISTITYLKNAFPEDSYSLENFGGLKLRILKKKCRDELAQFLSTALTQAFEAFDKKYLHQLALCFYEEECKVENLMEYHVFEFSYNPEGVTMSVRSKTKSSEHSTKYSFENVRERTIHLVRACVVVMQTCQQELPQTYDVSLRLYYNEDAPEGYQAPGFTPSPDTEDHLGATASDTIKLGCVETPFHRLVAKSYMKESVGSSNEAINPPMMSQMEQDDFNGPAKSVSDTGEPQLQCPCNKFDRGEDNEVLLLCEYCNTLQHAACFGLVAGAPPPKHCCTRCADEDPTRLPTDERLVSLSTKKRECLCIFRRALSICGRVSRISANRLASKLALSDANAAKLMRLMHSYGIIDIHDDFDLVTPRKIIPELLKSVVGKFFRAGDEENVVDRLLAETFTSQESQPDPVGDVLGPLEKVSLQNACNVGRVVENINNTNPIDVDDLTLKQYKEALLSNYRGEENLPLSGANDPIKDIENLERTTTTKRKLNENIEEDIPRLRSGVKTKRAKTKF